MYVMQVLNVLVQLMMKLAIIVNNFEVLGK
jgi:hypothetical protein